jgi:hypothetical protein
MVLSELINELSAIKKRHGDLECVYSSDDEGNSYSLVHYKPSLGLMNKNSSPLQFIIKHHGNINAVCIN